MHLITVIDSWEITGRGIIAELQFDGEGLPKGTLLKSLDSDESWEIIARIIFGHTAEKQKRFLSETEESSFLSFASVAAKEKSIADILLRESKGIYQYSLATIGHHEKPKPETQLHLSYA